MKIVNYSPVKIKYRLKLPLCDAFALLLLVLSFAFAVPAQVLSTADKAAQAKEAFEQGELLSKQSTQEARRNAISNYEKARSLYAELQDYKNEAIALREIGKRFRELSETSQAIRYLAESVNASQKSGDRDLEAGVLLILAPAYQSQGASQLAIDTYLRALNIYQSLNDQLNTAYTLIAIGEFYGYNRQAAKALEFFGKALEISKTLNDKKLDSRLYRNIAFTYQRQNQPEKALEYLFQALSATRSTNDKRLENLILNEIGLSYSRLREADKALQYYNESLAVSRAANDRIGIARNLSSIGTLYRTQGDYEKALVNHRQALEIFRSLGNRTGESVQYSYIGLSLDGLGETARGLENFFYSIFILQNVEYNLELASRYARLSDLWTQKNQRRLAILTAKESVNQYQRLRRSIRRQDSESQKEFIKNVEEIHRKLVGLLIDEKRFGEAYQVLNLFKDQQFFDLDLTSGENLPLIPFTESERQLSERLARAGETVMKTDGALQSLTRKSERNKLNEDETRQRAELEEKVKSSSEEFSALIKSLLGENVKGAEDSTNQSEPLDLQKTLAALSRRGQKAAAVYTLVGEDVFRALILSEDKIEAVSVPVKGSLINESALKLWGLLQSDKYDTTTLSKQLYDKIVRPIEEKLPPGTGTIMWSLDGNLRYLPMAAIFDGKKFLAEKYTHAVFTRTDHEQLSAGNSPVWNGHGFGASEASVIELLGEKISFTALPGVTTELNGIFRHEDSPKGLLEGSVLTDRKFTREAFLGLLKEKRPLVHIASHFSFYPGDKTRSFLLLGDGTALTVDELEKQAGLFQGVELLTLSACSTAAQYPDADGREVDAFAEVAQRLGVRSVMASLWQVSDNSTPWLMQQFYANRQGKLSLTKAEALQKAQMSLLKGTAKIKNVRGGSKSRAEVVRIVTREKEKRDNNTRADLVEVAAKDAPLYKKSGKPPFAHPFYWAPFILVGNWK